MVVDFFCVKVCEYVGEECIYWYMIFVDLVLMNIVDYEIDWLNLIFFLMQFLVGCSGKFNEFFIMFFKCFFVDCIEYVENWYQEQIDQIEDVEIGDWVVQCCCLYLCVDFIKIGKVDEDGIFMCSMYDWKWDFKIGCCLLMVGYLICLFKIDDVIDFVLQEVS